MNTQPQPRLGRRLKIVLAVSLALNLLFVGLIAGAAFRFGGKGGSHGPNLQSYGAPYMRALPREQRKMMSETLRAEGLMPSRAERRRFYQDVLEALRAETFDPASVEAAMINQRDVVSGVQTAAQNAWLKVVSDMSPAERLVYADALEERLERGPRRRKNDKERN